MIVASVSKRLGEFQADVTFEVRNGECVALVGPTGCGKTTTLRMIAGLEMPDSGRVVMDEVTLVDREQGICLAPQQRRMGVVFQDYALFPHMSVLQNVVYGASAQKQGKHRAQIAARRALATVGLEGLHRQRPSQLSGGQQQRAALARAIASGPRALLLDEPMSALDARTRRQVRGELRQLIARLGIQTIIVTHDPVDALTLGDAICVMDNGRVVQQGDRKELLSRPRSSFVAEFLGVNLLSGKARQGQHGMSEIHCDGTVFYALDSVEGDVLLTCNPWHVALSAERPAGSELNVLRGRVTEISHLGPRTRVTVENGVCLTAEITHASEERLNLRIGSQVYASFKASAAKAYR